MPAQITVAGAGAVGISTAMHLNQRGWDVTLIDRREPASETSFGNAGVINAGSLVPLNSPDLHWQLFRLLSNTQPELRFSFTWLIRHLPWVLAFLANSRSAAATRSAEALKALLVPALQEHKALMQRSGNRHRLHESGWLKVARHGTGFDERSFEARVLRRSGVAVQRLSIDELRDLEPALKPIFSAAWLFGGAAMVDNPGALLKEYARQFTIDGGTFLRFDIDAIRAATAGGFTLCAGPREHHTERLVVAAGPWSGDLLGMLGYRVPLAVERGYHQHYLLSTGSRLSRSVHDVHGGYVMGPMEQGLRVTTGVELNERDAPSRLAQLEQVALRVREAIAIEGPADTPIWRGSRPSLPDSCPMIGPAPDCPGLYMAFGHQHIGLMSAPITGKLLAEWISGEMPAAELAPFTPARYLKRGAVSLPPTACRAPPASMP